MINRVCSVQVGQPLFLYSIDGNTAIEAYKILLKDVALMECDGIAEIVLFTLLAAL